MGKRKLHDTTFFQCDWTGFPMRAAHAYMPDWSNGKLVKKGSYCNWESVVAHAQVSCSGGEQLQKVLNYAEAMCGVVVQPAPHYNELKHTKGTLTMDAFHKICAEQANPITAVKISPDGNIFEVIVTPTNGSFDFTQYLHKPYTPVDVATFHSMRRKGAKLTDRDLCVFYYPSKSLPPNAIASNAFKMQLHGDILLVHQSNEDSALPRERYVPFTRAMYDDLFVKKRKRTEQPCMTEDQYKQVKQTMEAQFTAIEQKVACDATMPAEQMKVHRLPTKGNSLAACLKERQMDLPPPLATPLD